MKKRRRQSIYDKLRRLQPAGLPKRQTIIVGMPMYRYTNPITISAVQNLMANTLAQGRNLELGMKNTMNTWIPTARMNLLKRACEEKAHMLLVDDDMSWGCGTDAQTGENFNPLLRLYDREKEIISGMCTGRSLPLSVYCGWRKPDGTGSLLTDRELIDPKNVTPFEVDFTSCAFMLVRYEAIKKINDFLDSEDGSWFGQENTWGYTEEGRETMREILLKAQAGGDVEEQIQDAIDAINHRLRLSNFLGEDYSFCLKAKLAGCEIWVDPSFEVRHHGDYPYTRLDWLAYRDAMAETGDKVAEERIKAIGG